MTEAEYAERERAAVARWRKTQLREMSEAPRDLTEIYLITSAGVFEAHWAHGGGDDQPCFGPAWFYHVGEPRDIRNWNMYGSGYFREIEHATLFGWMEKSEDGIRYG